MACGRDGRQTFPVWSLVVMHISHLLLGKQLMSSSVQILENCPLFLEMPFHIATMLVSGVWDTLNCNEPYYNKDRESESYIGNERFLHFSILLS